MMWKPHPPQQYPEFSLYPMVEHGQGTQQVESCGQGCSFPGGEGVKEGRRSDLPEATRGRGGVNEVGELADRRGVVVGGGRGAGETRLGGEVK